MNVVKKSAIERSLNWWVCDNLVNDAHKNQLGLLSMNFPRVFILLRNGDDIFADYDDFKNKLAEVNFLVPAERVSGRELEEILIDAYNFLVLQDEAEDEVIMRGEKNNDMF